MLVERVKYPQKKVDVLTSLKEKMERSPLVVLVNYESIPVEDINSIRRKFEEKGIEYIVAKNNLIKKSIEGTDKDGLVPLLNGMTGLVFSGEDGIDTAKTVRSITSDRKKLPGFVVKGGFFDGAILNSGIEVNKVADLPSREELLSTLLRTVQEGPRQILGVIQGPARDLVNLIKNYEHKLSEVE
jgi:large subunit ribosomal protein L10